MQRKEEAHEFEPVDGASGTAVSAIEAPLWFLRDGNHRFG